MAELADAYGSGPYGETRGGSSPLVSISAHSAISPPLPPVPVTLPASASNSDALTFAVAKGTDSSPLVSI